MTLCNDKKNYVYDLIFVVYGCDTKDKYKKQILKLQETHEKKINNLNNVKLLYFLGEKKENSLEADNIIHIDNLKDDYASATYKQWYGLKYVEKNYNTNYVMCFGTDTYVVLDKLFDLLNTLDSSENLYIGGHGCKRNLLGKPVYFHSGGPGFILSKSCLTKTCLKISNIEEFIKEWHEICNQSTNKEKLRDNLKTACDVAMGYVAQCDEVDAKMIKIKQGFYHCNYNGNPCCRKTINKKEIISCHNMSLKDFDSFTTILKDSEKNN